MLMVLQLFDSSGKSFVAEILMLRQVLSTGKMALLVLPYVSLCAEKVHFIICVKSNYSYYYIKLILFDVLQMATRFILG